MTDRPDDPGWSDAGRPDMPPPPPPPPVVGHPLSLESETPVRTGGVGARVIAGALGAVLLLGGVAFAATQLGSDPGTPEGAVADLFDALADEDLLGVLAALEPGERDTLSQPMEDLFGELERLEIVDDSFELTGISGIDLEFDDLTFRSEPVMEGLTRVYLTGGTASYDIDSSELPIGDFLAETLDRFGVDYEGYRDSDSEAITEGADDTFLAVRETGDGWRVSIGYTAAEAARISMGKPVPAVGLSPVGADSPEAAVDGFLQAAAALDIRGVVARMSPHEMGALQHYWPVLVEPGSLPDAGELGVEITLSDLEYRSSTSGDRAQVFIDSFGIDVVDEDGTAGGATIADGCITLRGEAAEVVQEDLDAPDGPLCEDELRELFEEAMAESGGMGFDLDELDLMLPGADGEVPSIGITTTKVDGQWYVAPIRTYADVSIELLRLVEREHIESVLDAIEDFFGGFGAGFGGGFDPFDPDAFGEIGEWEEWDETWDEDWAPHEGFEDDLWSDDGMGTSGVRTDALVEELVWLFAGDTDVAGCVLGELKATATPNQLAELADAYAYDLDPSPATWDLFEAALTACGA